MDEKNTHAGVVHMHGHLLKTEQFSLINIFCGKIVVAGYHPKTRVATSAAALGVDHPNIQDVCSISNSPTAL